MLEQIRLSEWVMWLHFLHVFFYHCDLTHCPDSLRARGCVFDSRQTNGTLVHQITPPVPSGARIKKKTTNNHRGLEFLLLSGILMSRHLRQRCIQIFARRKTIHCWMLPPLIGFQIWGTEKYSWPTIVASNGLSIELLPRCTFFVFVFDWLLLTAQSFHWPQNTFCNLCSLCSDCRVCSAMLTFL